MHVISVALQVVGACLAGYALVDEYRASRLTAPMEPLPEVPATNSPNPWAGFMLWGVTGSSPRLYPVFFNDPEGRNLQSAIENVHKDIRKLERARNRALEEWDRQQRVNHDLQVATRRILSEQREGRGDGACSDAYTSAH